MKSKLIHELDNVIYLLEHKALNRTAHWQQQIKRAEPHEDKLKKAIESMFSKQKVTALEKLKGAVNRNHELLDVKQARESYIAAVPAIVLPFIQMEMQYGYNSINPGGQIPSIVNQQALDWLNTRIGWAADELGEQTASQLSQILSDGYAQGLSMQQIAQNIQDASCFSDARSMLVARTEIMGASNFGNTAGYKAAGVTQVQWKTAEDERTCEICDPMDGDIEDIDDAPPLPASTHPNCRCLWQPVIPD